MKLGPLIAAGSSADRSSGPASSNRTRRAGSCDQRAASTAPAEPEPITTAAGRGTASIRGEA